MNQTEEEKVRQIVVNYTSLIMQCALNDDLLQSFKNNPIPILRNRVGMIFPTGEDAEKKIHIYIDEDYFRWPIIILKVKVYIIDGEEKYKYILIDEAMTVTEDWWRNLGGNGDHSQQNQVNSNKDQGNQICGHLSFEELLSHIKIEYPQAKPYTDIDELIEKIKYYYPDPPGELITELRNWEDNEEPWLAFIILPFLHSLQIPKDNNSSQGK
jgi:hypothetical protein